MPTIRWSNGQTDTAETWEALLTLIGETQPEPMGDEQIREELAKRAWRWTLTNVDPSLPAALFFGELEHAKVIVISSSTTNGKGV